MTSRKIEYWVIPPEADGEFAAHMEKVLDVYEKPYDAAAPVLCMDEQPVQLLKETRKPIPATPEHGKRIDYEYERAGTANIFMFTEPLAGWREVAVRERKTKVDWAVEMARLLEGRYAGCEKVVLVCDNLNTHKPACLYEAFEPEQARRIAERLEWHYTPKHGSWLNMAEIELSVLHRQCLDRRIESAEEMARQVDAWQEDRNEREVGVQWRFTTADARVKLHKLYPTI